MTQWMRGNVTNSEKEENVVVCVEEQGVGDGRYFRAALQLHRLMYIQHFDSYSDFVNMISSGC